MLADLIRVWYGPLSEPICNGLQLARHTIQVMGFLLWMVVAILKFWIVCIRKSLPTMDDDFVTTFVTIASFMLALLYSLIGVILPQKPTLAHVSLTHCSNILNWFSSYFYSGSVVEFMDNMNMKVKECFLSHPLLLDLAWFAMWFQHLLFIFTEENLRHPNSKTEFPIVWNHWELIASLWFGS